MSDKLNELLKTHDLAMMCYVQTVVARSSQSNIEKMEAHVEKARRAVAAYLSDQFAQKEP